MDETPSGIHSIKAKRVLGEFTYEIAFSSEPEDGRMRLIYAPNGRGKTNLLRAINAALSASTDALQTLIEIPFAELTVKFVSGGTISITRENDIIGSFKASAFSPMQEQIDIDVNSADFAGRLYRRALSERENFTAYIKLVADLSPGAVFIGDDRLASEFDESPQATQADRAHRQNERRRGSVTGLLDAVERMLTQSALVSLSRDSEQTGIYEQLTKNTLSGTARLTTSEARSALEDQIELLLGDGIPLEQYQLLSMRQLRNISTQLHAARANDRQLPVLHQILKPYLDSLGDQIDSLAPAYELIDTYVKGVNKFLDRKELKFTASRGIILVGRNGDPLHPDSLSSGERHLIILLSRAILATVTQPLLIIDEPELSLGIEWQRDLIPELLRCTASASIQFIVASHSVQVMGAVESADIVSPVEAL
ncbi:MAG: ATP-binding protein [Arthrobacter sp.]|nr:ATP-binding protein [Arthrobacter sp.]